MNVKLSELFFICTKIGALLLGGGYVIVPLLISEFVDKKRWLTKEEVLNFYALGQCVPGIIAPNTIMFLGYKLRGKMGAIAALLGLCLSPVAAILLVASFISVIANLAIMKNIFWGVNIAIIVLIFLTIKEVWSTSVVDKLTFLFFIFAFLLCIFGLSPAWVIVFAISFGVILTKVRSLKK